MVGEKIRRWSSVILVIVLNALFLLLLWRGCKPLDQAGLKMYDGYFQFRGRIASPPGIVVAAIDEKSIRQIGRWTWGRDVMADLVRKLDQAGARLIVYDVIFSEGDKSDPLFARAMKECGRVVLAVAFRFDEEVPPSGSESLTAAAFVEVEHEERYAKYRPIMAPGALPPVDELIGEASLGHIFNQPDDDGVTRWEPFIVGHEAYLYPSLGLRAAAILLGVPLEKIHIVAGEAIALGNKRRIPTDVWGRALIPYYGGAGTFTTVSVADVLAGKIERGVLKDSVVLVGATATGIADLLATPFSPTMSGVEKHATVIAALLDGKIMAKAPRAAGVALLGGLGLLVAAASRWLRMKGIFLAAGLALAGMVLLSYGLFAFRGFWLDITCHMAFLGTSTLGVVVYKYTVEERKARAIRKMFSTYVSPRVVNELIAHPDLARLGGERKKVTVLFTDVRGFSTFSEKHTPEEVVSCLNAHLKEITQIVFAWEGTLDKFIGDCVMAFWGAPLVQENHAELALHCALNIVDRIESLYREREAAGLPCLRFGIGINSGEAVVGNMGVPGLKLDYTVIGDDVNIASRVESLTKNYGASLLVTGSTIDGVRNALAAGRFGNIVVEMVGTAKVKGREAEVSIYKIVPGPQAKGPAPAPAGGGGH